jgi:hypothetical protein
MRLSACLSLWRRQTSLIGVCRRPSIPSAPSLARTRQAGLELLGDFGVLQDDGARVLHPRVDVLVVAVDQFGVELFDHHRVCTDHAVSVGPIEGHQLQCDE